LLQGDDPALREHVLDALLAQPSVARRLLSWDWIDARLRSPVSEDLLHAARAATACRVCARSYGDA